MRDQFPENMELAVDRESLCKYLRVKWFLSWLLCMCYFGFFAGLAIVGGRLDRHDYHGTAEVIQIVATGIGAGCAVTVLPAIVLYLMLSHRRAAILAKNLQVRVEGAFLRITQESGARVDRKLHFRAIVDYTTVEGRLMRRFGLKSLLMTTIGGGPRNTIQVVGLKDCEKVRDTLALIDSIREKE